MYLLVFTQLRGNLIVTVCLHFQDYRGLHSKICSTSSLYSESSSVGHSYSSAIDIHDDASESSSLLSRDVSESFPLSPPTMPLMQDSMSSKPMPIKGKRFNRDVMLSSSAPASGSSSPLPGFRNSPRQQFYRVRKSSSSNSFTVFVGMSNIYIFNLTSVAQTLLVHWKVYIH